MLFLMLEVSNLNQIALTSRAQDIHHHPCGDLEILAEQEFSAFFSAVTELFGSEQAELSAEDWIQELASVNVLPDSSDEWRRLSIKVSAQLAKRVTVAQGMPNEKRTVNAAQPAILVGKFIRRIKS
jgi:hypothetical protein